MDAEKDKTLCNKYPNLYRDRNKSSHKTSMCWGFCCGDGWYDLIDELSAKIETIIVEMKNRGKPEDRLPGAAQVKQKFGGLRFYMYNATQEIYNLIHEAEERSSRTCEICGAEGKTRPTGWVKVLCDTCYKRRG